MRFSFSFTAATMLFGGSVFGQQATPETTNPVSQHTGGFRLESVSGFFNYYWTPGGVPTGSPPNFWMDQSSAGAAATVDYSRFGERSGISISYTPSYVASAYGQGYTSKIHNHALSFNWRRNLTPKWTYTLAGAGVVTTLADALFLPTMLDKVAGTPATFDELSSAMAAGKSNNNELAAVVTGPAVVESPSGMLLYGGRMITSTLQTSISYSPSTRLSFHANVGASRSQALSDSGPPAGVRPDYLISHTTTGSGSIGIGYSLSPRTQLSADWLSNRVFSSLQEAYIHTANVSLAHTLSERWFVQMHGGGGFVDTIRAYYAVPGGTPFQAGGSIGYKTRAHTFLANVQRSFADSYGLGAGSTVSANGAWNWRRPGNAWSTTASFGQEWLRGTAFQTANNWRATLGLVRTLGEHMAVSTQYGYLSDSRFIGGPGSRGGQNTIRVSVVWLPGVRAAKL